MLSEERLSLLRQMAHGLAVQFGPACEVVIHDLTLALRFCDRFLLMRDGQVYRCGGLEVLDKTALREVYGVDAEPVVVNGRHIVLVNE